MIKLFKKFGLFLLCCFFIHQVLALDDELDSIIIKFKPTQSQQQQLTSGKMTSMNLLSQQMKPYSSTQVQAISKTIGMSVTDAQSLGTGAHVLRLPKYVNPADMQQIIKEIQQSYPNLEYVEPNYRVKPMAAPQLNPVQWDMQLTFATSQIYPTWVGDNFTGAFSTLATYGVLPGTGVTVAVIDTGYTPHLNFLSQLQALAGSSGSYGYQFISDCRTAGSCIASTPSNQAVIKPQPNGLDLGDYVSQNDIATSNGYFESGCLQPASDWHGTHVTGSIIGQGYDGESGLEGAAYASKVVPVRVLGKCGGYTSDIVDGMLWAGGLHPTISNPNPAQVINMSLGSSPSGCIKSEQDAINKLLAANIIVVTAAGNSNSNVSTSSPANCQNVISVAAKGPNSVLASYSNFGNTTITASGGSSIHGAGTASLIYSTIWGSSQQYESSDGGTYQYYNGTSMAAPHAAAAIADMISYIQIVKKGSWNLPYIITALQSSALPLTTGTVTPGVNYNGCNSSGCVTTGALNTAGAINYVINNNPTPTPTPTPAPMILGSGGCSAISNGSDISLILVLSLVGVLYLYRRRNKYKKNN